MGLFHKIKQQVPDHMYEILKSYQFDSHFLAKYEDAITEFKSIKSCVPQGSVLDPVLYLLYTVDLPTTDNTLIAIFADDRAIMASHSNPTVASRHTNASQ